MVEPDFEGMGLTPDNLKPFEVKGDGVIDDLKKDPKKDDPNNNPPQPPAKESSEDSSPDLGIVDPTLLESADTNLVQNIEELLQKEDGTLTEEEEKLLKDNKDLVTTIANKEIPLVSQLMSTEGYVESGTFDDSIDGVQSYLEYRDKVRDKSVLNTFLEENPQVKDYYQHVVVEKNPPVTFFAQQNKPDILSVKLEKITDNTPEDQKNNIISNYEAVVRANLKSTGVDSSIAESVIESAKDKGTLENMAFKSLESLNKAYNDRIEKVNKSYQDQIKEQREKEQQEIEKTTELIKNGKVLDNLIIPKADQANFVKYVSSFVNDNRETMADKKYNQLSLAQRTAIDYIIYKDFKLPFGTRSTIADKFKIAKKANDTRSRENVKGTSTRGNAGANLREEIAAALGHI